MTVRTMAGLSVEAVAPVLPRDAHPYWTQERVAHALGTGPAGPHAFHGICTDTRAIVHGDVFVALVGEHHNAHHFLADARDRGAAALVVSDATAAVGLGLPVYVVSDTLVALGQLARAWRKAWGQTVIAVAGSNGKTTTKELVKAALRTELEVHATTANFNNLVGVPLTLLSIPATCDVAVVEVGTNAHGEIARLRAIVEPDMAVLTSIGEEHLEGLGDLAGVLREESDVFDQVALAIVPSAQPEVGAAATGRAQTVISAGLSNADVVPDAWGLESDGRVWIASDGARGVLPLRGAHQAANAMLALAVARACGVSTHNAMEGMAAMPVPSMRGVWQHLGDAVLINDAYNANPASMRAALALLQQVEVDRQHVAVLGSMRELGIHSAAQHRDILMAALASTANIVALVGEFAEVWRAAGSPQYATAPGASDATAEHHSGDVPDPNAQRVVAASDVDELWALLEPRLQRNAVILLKASRGMKLERLVPHITTWATLP